MALTGLPGHHPGADRGEPIDPASLRRVLVVRADNLGDVVTATPVLRALRAAAPHVHLELLASPVGTALAPLVPELDDVLTASASWQQLPGARAADAAGERALLAAITARRFDTLFVLTSATQSAWPAAHVGLLAGIGRRVVHSREFGGAVATHWVTPPPPDTHAVDRGRHLLAAVGIDPGTAGPSLRVPDPERARADALLARTGIAAGGAFALLAPGASCPARRYPAERFGAAARTVAAAGLPVRVAGPASEAELVAAVVAAAGHPGVRALPPTSVPGFAAEVARATVAITGNSGGMHVADALGTPVAVAFGGAEDPAVARPRSVPAAVLARPVPCAPCRLLTCPYGLECLDVDPAELAAAALALVPARRPEEVPC